MNLLANKNQSMTGLSAAYIAPLLTDTSAGTTYGLVQPLVGAIDVQVDPNNADPDIQYADDNEFDRLYPDPELTVTAEMTALPLDMQRTILGHTLDANGVTVKAATDEPPYFAIGIRGTRRKGGYRNMWMLKCVAKPISQTFHTKEGKTITRQTGKVAFSAIKRISDARYEYVADDNEDGFTGGATFFSTVYETTPSTITLLHALTWALVAPVKAATPGTTMNGTGYTSAVVWTPTAATFAGSTVYTAVVTITAAAGYAFCPAFVAGSIASLPSGSVVTREGDSVITVTKTYAATGA